MFWRLAAWWQDRRDPDPEDEAVDPAAQRESDRLQYQQETIKTGDLSGLTDLSGSNAEY